MISLLAQAANTLDAESIGKLIAILIGGGVVGGGAYKLGKSRVTLDGQPIETRRAKEYVTQREFDAVKEDIGALRSLVRDSETQAHKRMDNMAETLSELVGIVSVIRDHIIKPRTRN